ncbi:NUDIX domain-containing protein [Actibacterium lipolyticum]|uniref:NUDIX domain protein n=1 Tax=Actibacterium lipolyticum TaxID=1524263 RepID=A0A238KUI2_9RHOB|nr:NUDIX domain-containing protein [Actibacterium lipolyticum]SMX46251.1 NUDIX domain protein [Actibacterium lipolyticum]
MPSISRVCAVVLRQRDGLEVLAFRHPKAGLQLIKGRPDAGETPPQTAKRELFEESGVQATATNDIGLAMVAPGQIWAFVDCATAPLPENWVHHCADDDGLMFEFFWHPLNAEPGADWHATFRQALGFLRDRKQ